MSTNHLFELNAEVREVFGSGASRRLRRLENRVPAILYGASEPPLPVSLEHNQVVRALENEAFYSHILTIKIDGVEQKAVLKDLQRHAYKPRILHVDLMRVSAKEKMTLSVPLHFKGEEIAPGVKEAGGVLNKLPLSVTKMIALLPIFTFHVPLSKKKQPRRLNPLKCRLSMSKRMQKGMPMMRARMKRIKISLSLAKTNLALKRVCQLIQYS